MRRQTRRPKLKLRIRIQVLHVLNQIQQTEVNPFISHDFLHAIEASCSVAARTGWQPQHLIAETPDGAVAGVVPCYLKSHSRGEYVFDQGWAEAYERAGGAYYPKLQVAVPFTPVTGRRLLVAPGFDPETIRTGLAAALVELCRLRQASSAHVTFATEEEWRALGDAGFLQRNDQQFHWENQGYRTFEDFLGALAARKRKAIRRERRDALEGGVTVALPDRRRPHRGGVGRVLRLLHGHRQRANGAVPT